MKYCHYLSTAKVFYALCNTVFICIYQPPKILDQLLAHIEKFDISLLLKGHFLKKCHLLFADSWQL